MGEAKMDYKRSDCFQRSFAVWAFGFGIPFDYLFEFHSMDQAQDVPNLFIMPYLWVSKDACSDSCL
jgi:hypothetical protein